MGNQPSPVTEKKSEPKEIIINKLKDTSSGILSNFSYKGVKTDTDISDIKDTTAETIISIEKIEIKETKIPITFVWKEGGTNIYVTGSFSNWNQWFQMVKINNNFELVLVNTYNNI
jgi:hypothetical protein